MPKKRGKGEYNDFLDGEKLRDNAEARTSLQPSSSRQDVSPPPTRRETKGKGKGKKGKGEPKKPQLTHFLCLPLINEASRSQFEGALERFKKEVEREGVVPVGAVRPLGTLHLTLGVMSLEEEELEGADKCLQELDLRNMLRAALAETRDAPTQDAEHIALSIDLKALVPMQQTHKTSILYAEPSDTSSRLYPFASALRDYFTEKGFLVEDKRPLKLHATIVNIIYAKPGGRHGKRKPSKRQDKAEPAVTAPIEDTASEKGDEQTTPADPATGGNEALAQKEPDRSEVRGPNAKSWMRFDATHLIERHRDTVWAEKVSIEQVQICKMGAKEILDEEGNVVDEKYEVVAEKLI